MVLGCPSSLCLTPEREWTRGATGVDPNLGKNLGIITHLENV